MVIDKGYHSARFYFDKNNIQQKAEFFSLDGTYASMAGPYNPEYSYSKITYEYSYGMISKEYHWDDADNLVYITVYESSDYSTKNFESTYFTDPDGSLILSPDYGVARIEINYDESGRITKFVCYDEKGNIIDSDVTPYFGVKAGYSMSYIMGFYSNPTFGIYWWGKKQVGVNISLGYNLQMVDLRTYYYAYSLLNHDVNSESIGGISLKLGIIF